MTVGFVLEIYGYFKGIHEDKQKDKGTKGILLIFVGLLMQAIAIIGMVVID
jgi:hypothetical protein